MNDTLPALREKPMTLPSSAFQVSSTSNPRTSRYQPRLVSRSFTVKLGDAEESARDPDPALGFAEDALLARAAGAFFFARLVVFFDFFAAISPSKGSDAMTAQASSQGASEPSQFLQTSADLRGLSVRVAEPGGGSNMVNRHFWKARNAAVRAPAPATPIRTASRVRSGPRSQRASSAIPAPATMLLMEATMVELVVRNAIPVPSWSEGMTSLGRRVSSGLK